VRRRNPPFTRAAGCSDPRTGPPVEPGRRLGCPDGADGDGEGEPDGDGDWEPPDGGEDGGGDGVTGVLGNGTGGVGSGRLGGGGSVGVVIGPTSTAGA
jgi:hypothetical protein